MLSGKAILAQQRVWHSRISELHAAWDATRVKEGIVQKCEAIGGATTPRKLWQWHLAARRQVQKSALIASTPRKVWQLAPKTMALEPSNPVFVQPRPENYGISARRAWSITELAAVFATT